jgi:hypothetical protein
MNIKTQITDISNRCKDTFTHTIDDLSEKYDNIYYYNKYSHFFKGQLDITRQIKAKVSLATAWLSNIDFIVHNNEELDELRKKKGNSIK